MERGEVYRVRTKTKGAEVKLHGDPKAFRLFTIVSRNEITSNPKIRNVVCAPIHSEVLGLSSEVFIGIEEGVKKECAIRCDFLGTVPKEKLSDRVGRLKNTKIEELDKALVVSLGINLHNL